METINSRIINSTQYWAQGYDGSGVTVGLIDTGVVPVNGLSGSGKVVHGPDLSFDATLDNLRYLDLYGHGTHIAGIIAGRDDAVSGPPNPGALRRNFLGIAPGAQILSVKVGDAEGATDASQVIAALNWIVEHRRDHGMNVRVVNLAYGVDAAGPYQSDPLAYAVEAAWRAGIVVVVAAGNDGNQGQLRSPAIDPYVLSVGAIDSNGTPSTNDDRLAPFSNCGSPQRPVDLVAPGVSVISLRDPGSYADTFFPEARVGNRFFRGSGTSQAAAIVSGAVALLLDQQPDLTPDQVKALLTATAQPIPGLSVACQGSGLLDLQAAFGAEVPGADQSWPEATNSEPYQEAAVGGYWEGQTWAGQTWAGQTWAGQTWAGQTWAGQTWAGQTWAGQTWAGQTWAGQTWASYVWN
jgi:serine protease AprX